MRDLYTKELSEETTAFTLRCCKRISLILSCQFLKHKNCRIKYGNTRQSELYQIQPKMIQNLASPLFSCMLL